MCRSYGTLLLHGLFWCVLAAQRIVRGGLTLLEGRGVGAPPEGLCRNQSEKVPFCTTERPLCRNQIEKA